MRVKFVRDAKYPQVPPNESKEYKAGQEYEVSDDHGHRWIRRGAAVEVKAKAQVVAAKLTEKSEK